MDRLFVQGLVNAAQSGDGPPLFLFHSLLSDRASFDAVAPALSRSFRVLVPELPGFGRSPAVSGGQAGGCDVASGGNGQETLGASRPRSRLSGSSKYPRACRG